jgi:signal transduction histidine kinase
MLGLGLVAGNIALLLAGTLYGLASYRSTMKRIDSKVAELKAAEAVKDAIRTIRPLQKNQAENYRNARLALVGFQEALKGTLQHGFETEKGVLHMRGLIDDLAQQLDNLEAGVRSITVPRAVAMGSSSREEGEKAEGINGVLQALERDSGDLHNGIYHDFHRCSQDAGRTFKTTLWIVFTISGGGVVLMCGFLRFFYRWVFYPIRDLEEGARRVAQGDFEGKIDVHSGDEMEDLAAAFNDMTGRLREMYRDLARQVNERSRQLVRSERLASVGFLAAGVAHEINNPLASIAFCSEALEQRLYSLLRSEPRLAAPRTVTGAEPENDAQVVTKYLKMIQQEAFRCKAITQRLLEFSRGGERRREPTDLAELVQGVLDVVQHLQNCKGKRIAFEPAGRLVAWVNGQEVKSVVLNLVVNALDSMDDGGTLSISLAERDRMAELVFTDTGCGMSAEILENIFEPFFTRSRTGKGTGLGLAISSRVISQHGGEIEAASPGLNRGSTFTVRLPLQPAEPVKEEPLGHAA